MPSAAGSGPILRGKPRSPSTPRCPTNGSSAWWYPVAQITDSGSRRFSSASSTPRESRDLTAVTTSISPASRRTRLHGQGGEASSQDDRPRAARASRRPSRHHGFAAPSDESGDRPKSFPMTATRRVTMKTESKDAGQWALPGRLDETLIRASLTTLEDLEEIVTNVGRSPWLWGHAVSFDLERRVPGPLQDPTHRDRPVRLGGGAGHGPCRRPRRATERRSSAGRGELIRGHRRGRRRACPRSAHPHPARGVGLQLRSRLHPPGPPRSGPRHRPLDSCLHPGHIGLTRLRGHAGGNASRD